MQLTEDSKSRFLAGRSKMEYKEKKALVVGMAKSGVASAALLSDLGAHVIIYDAKKRQDLPCDIADELKRHDYTDMLGQDIMPIIPDIDIMVLSPGVPPGLPFIQVARDLGKHVIAEIELGFSVSKADFIAITGTNGKTTTTALTGEIFKNAGFNTFVLGNIGVPVTQEALNTKQGDVVVAETAALQLDATVEYRPVESAILNITEDHLDRYGNMENYIAAKAKIFKNQTEENFCVLNLDNEYCRSLIPNITARIVGFSVEKKLESGAFLNDGMLCFRLDGQEKEIIRAEEIKIPGRHNLENALAAAALACLYGIQPKVIADTLRTFGGVEHRIEFVRTVRGVDFINDSKGTNPDATIKAVQAMKKPTVLILGGYDKKSDFKNLFDNFTDQIKSVVLLGATAGKLAEAAHSAGFEDYIMATSMQDAVQKAFSVSGEGYNVLLSPACASYDMFSNFEERGAVFKQIVKEL
jgi:UDP-N-acetylmuramoylalanine--D-glutamate ligase